VSWGEIAWRRWPQLLGLGVFVVGLWAQGDALVGVFYDDGIYVVLAKALATGEGYRNIHLPGSPAGVHYPFLYPALLSLLWRLWPSFPANVVLFQLLDSAALGIAAWAIALHGRRLEWPAAVQYVALPAGFLAFPLLTIVGVRFSEPLFLALWATSLLVVDRDEVTERRAFVAGLLSGLATLTRTIGVAVVAGVVVALWIRRRRRAAVAAAVAGAVVMLPWFAWLLTHPGAVDPRIASNYGTYVDAAGQAGILGLLPGVNVGVLGPLARLALPALPGALWYPLAVLLLGALLWGAASAWRRVPAFVISLVFYVIVVALWPYASDRFVWILAPWAALLGLGGGWLLWRRGAPTRWVVAVLAVAVSSGYLPREAASLGGRGFARTAEGISAPFHLLLPSITEETPPGTVLAVSDEALVYLYSGRTAVPSYLFRWQGRRTDPLTTDESVAYYCENGVTHLALTGPGAAAGPVVRELASADESLLEPLFQVTSGPALFRFSCPD
jgi:hypothetical protein